MGAPDVYIRAKVPEDIYDTMQKFAEMRKLERMSLVRDFDLFPIVERLLNLERKYGDSLSFEDLNGSPPKKKTLTSSFFFENTRNQASMVDSGTIPFPC
jgi:hypothetical protein